MGSHARHLHHPNGDKIEMLLDGRVDAVVAQEREYAEALEHGLPILLDTARLRDNAASSVAHEIFVRRRFSSAA
jgi:hypothetical protein